jgi:hypothetical protein
LAANSRGRVAGHGNAAEGGLAPPPCRATLEGRESSIAHAARVTYANVRGRALVRDRRRLDAGGSMAGCAWTSYPSCSGPASATSGRSTRSTCWRILTWYSEQPGASPALSGAPLADLSWYAKKSTANGDTRSGLRLRLRIAVPGRAADADPPQHLTCGKFNSRSLVAGFRRIFGRPP